MANTWQWIREAPAKLKLWAPIVVMALSAGTALTGYGIGVGEGRALAARVAATEAALAVSVVNAAQAKVEASKEVLAAKEALRGEIAEAVTVLRNDVAKTTSEVAELRGTLNAIAKYFNIPVPARSP